jgi:hypothetical protein
MPPFPSNYHFPIAPYACRSQGARSFDLLPGRREKKMKMLYFISLSGQPLAGGSTGGGPGRVRDGKVGEDRRGE